MKHLIDLIDTTHNMSTLKNNGYAYLFFNKDTGMHTLYNINTGEFERYAANKGYSGYTLKYKNTELEFCSSYDELEKARLLRYMLKVQRWGEQHPDSNSTMMNVYRKYIAN